MRERDEYDVRSTTQSVWGYLNQAVNIKKFKNEEYQSTEDALYSDIQLHEIHSWSYYSPFVNDCNTNTAHILNNLNHNRNHNQLISNFPSSTQSVPALEEGEEEDIPEMILSEEEGEGDDYGHVDDFPMMKLPDEEPLSKNRSVKIRNSNNLMTEINSNNSNSSSGGEEDKLESNNEVKENVDSWGPFEFFKFNWMKK